MKTCVSCGAAMTEEATFCEKCGARNDVSGIVSQAIEQENRKKGRKRNRIAAIVCYVIAAVFAVGAFTVDITMLSVSLLNAFLGTMFFCLWKNVGDKSHVSLKVGYKGISKTLFVFLCVFFGIVSFAYGMELDEDAEKADDEGVPVGKIENDLVENGETTPQIPETPDTNANGNENGNENESKAEPTPKSDVPEEYADDCPIAVTVSLYDDVLGLPNLKCALQNLTDKEILAVEIYFVPYDVYSEEIRGLFVPNKFTLDSTAIPAYASDTKYCSLLDDDIKSGDVYVYSVYFEDGSAWGDRNASTKTIKKYGLKSTATF